MYENENYDKLNYYAIITTLFLFLLPIIIYFSVIIYYLKQNYKKNITLLWIDYILTISIGIIFSIIYLFTIIINKINRINHFNNIITNGLYILSNSFLLFYFYTVINNLIFDIIKSYSVSHKIVKLTNIVDTELNETITQFKDIELMDIIKPKKHYYFLIIINILNFLLVFIFILIHTHIYLQDNFCSINHYNIYLFKYYYFIVFIVLIVYILIINVHKKILINNKYYTNNKFVMNIYNIYYNQLIYYIDILNYKIGIDLFVNIPLIFFITFSMFNTFGLIFLEFCLLLFVIIGGNFLLNIDNNNKYKNKTDKSDILKKLFSYKDINFSQNGFNIFMNEYDYYLNCSLEEKKILSKLNIYFIENNIINKYNYENNYNENNYNENNYNEINYDEIKEDEFKVKEENSDDKDSNNDNISEFDIISEYYIIYKLLYIFFDKNKELYSNLLKKVKRNTLFRQYSIETNSSGKKSNKKKTKKQKEGENIINKDEYKLNIEKVSRLSQFESKNIITFLKYKKDDIFKTVQEKEFLEEINKKYKKTKKSKINFVIEALSHPPLFEIFPFYQLKIEDILKSLNPSNNIKIFKQFLSNLNKSNNNESDKNSNIKNSINESVKNSNIKNTSNESEKNSNIKNTSNESEKNSNNESVKNSNVKNTSNESEKNSNNESVKNSNVKNTSNESEKNSNTENEKNSSNENDKKINENNENKINVNEESKKKKDNTYNNESDSENKSSESSESNCYHTYNYLLMMEIYNKTDFINYKEISELTQLFKNHVLNNVKEMKSTFLPLLIGIYNIKFLGNDKIIIIYRNPLYFTNFSRFNNWINFYITEAAEKTKKPIVTKNDIIDIDEIEIKDNIKLNDSDYEEIKKVLKNDFLFLSSLNFEVFPIIHLFIGDESAGEEKMKKNNVMSESFLIGSLGSQHSFSVLLNSSSEGYNSVNNSLKKKDSLIGDYNSLLEKEYYAISGNKDVHTIKIYLTNYFRLGNKVNKEQGKMFIFNSESYGIFLQSQLMTYLTKNSFSSDEKELDNEKIKSPQLTIKSVEDEKIILKCDS